ncbi:MAG TPA: hypothetical protein VJG32_04275 [Anaerolineae bacterium]|nr:hypothetical protein [Anaerolineae bacterium]
MSQPNHVTHIEAEDPAWKDVYRIGGAAALILLLYSVVTLIVLTLLGAAPSTAAETFALLQNNRIIGLLRLDVLTVFVYMPLLYLLFLGIYVALRPTQGAYTTLATALVFVGVTLLLATPSAFSMVDLSDKYAVATTETQRSQLLAAGEAILASDMWHGTGAFLGGMLLQSGAVLISVVMLRSKVFSQTIAYLGILTHGLDLAHFIFLLMAPGLGKILIAIAGTLYLIWFPLVGRRLLQLGRRESKALPQPAQA